MIGVLGGGMRQLTQIFFLAAASIGLAICVPAWSAEPTVYDNAKLFSAETIAQANDIVGRIKKDFDKEVVVETFASIPQSLRADFQQEDRHQFFQKWLHSRARHYDVNGVFILICRDPGHLELEPGAHTREKAFSRKNADEVAKLMLPAFHDRNFDGGLISGLELIEKRMRENLASELPVPPRDDQRPAATRPDDHTTEAAPQTLPSKAPATGPATAPALP